MLSKKRNKLINASGEAGTDYLLGVHETIVIKFWESSSFNLDNANKLSLVLGKKRLFVYLNIAGKRR